MRKNLATVTNDLTTISSPRVICLSPKKEGFCWQVEDEIDDCNVDVPIKYLHQLQNIYFTLTGTELNVEKIYDARM